MNAPPPQTVSEEGITEAALFFNIIEENDVENGIDIDKTELFFCHNVTDFQTVSYVCFFLQKIPLYRTQESLIYYHVLVIFSDMK